MFPLCESNATDPAGKSLEVSSSLEVWSSTPRQFGPSSTAPAARTRAARAASRRFPSSPDSPSPALIPTIARAPTASASSTADSKPAAGTATTTRSTGSAMSRKLGTAGRPSTVALQRLTRCTGRSPRSARTAIQLPYLLWSSLAPTTATERGAKSAVRSRAAVMTPPA